MHELQQSLKQRAVLSLLLLVLLPVIVSHYYRKQNTASRSSEPFQTFGGIPFYVNDAKFSPDGKLLALAIDMPNRVELIDTATWRTTRTLSLNSVPDQLAFSASGQRLSVHSDKEATIWSTTTWQPMRRIPADMVLMFFPDGRMLIVDNHHALVVGSSGEKPISSYKYWGAFREIAISPDSKTLALGGLGWVKLLDTTTWRAKKAFKGDWKDLYSDKDWVHALAFSPDGTLLAAGGVKSVVKVWHTTSWREAYTLARHAAGFDSVAFSPDSKLLVTTGINMQFWDANTGRLNSTVDKGFLSAEFSPSGRLLATTNEIGATGIWNAPVSGK